MNNTEVIMRLLEAFFNDTDPRSEYGYWKVIEVAKKLGIDLGSDELL